MKELHQMASGLPEYPWFGQIEGDDIAQGDIFEKFPVLIPPIELAFDETAKTAPHFQWEKLDLIVMSQSCDLQKGREKVEDVIVCAVWKRSELPDRSNDWMEEVRKGRNPSFHVLADCQLAGHTSEPRVVDFRRVYALPLPFVRRMVQTSKHIRLLPPYREHLSQLFARFFMRVGLPSDIPSFKKK